MDKMCDRQLISYSDCVIRLRLSLLRNCSDFLFPLRMQAAESRRFLAMVSNRLQRLPEGAWNFHRPEKMSDDEFFYYRDRGLLPDDYSRVPLPLFFCTDRNGVTLFFLNREGIELRLVSSEFEPMQLLGQLVEADRRTEKVLPYAVSLNRGYLNSHQSRTGAGLEAEVLLSLPALHQTDEGDRLLKIAAAENLKIEPYFCPVLKAPVNGILSVSTTSKHDETEEEMLARFSGNLGTIIKMERLKRRDWNADTTEQIASRYREAIERINLSVKISLAESYEILETIRTAVLAGVAEHPCTTLNWLFDFLKESSLTHFRSRFAGASEPMMYDSLRAHLMKETFCDKTEVVCTKD